MYFYICVDMIFVQYVEAVYIRGLAFKRSKRELKSTPVDIAVVRRSACLRFCTVYGLSLGLVQTIFYRDASLPSW